MTSPLIDLVVLMLQGWQIVVKNIYLGYLSIWQQQQGKVKNDAELSRSGVTEKGLFKKRTLAYLTHTTLHTQKRQHSDSFETAPIIIIWVWRCSFDFDYWTGSMSFLDTL